MDSLQALRAIDKFDKIGHDGVVELLQKPLGEFGADAMEWQAELIGQLVGCKGLDNEATLRNLAGYMKRVGSVRTRIDLMVMLEEISDPSGTTAWDRLLAMPENDDETWKDGGRPKNIGWALDDIMKGLGNLE